LGVWRPIDYPAARMGVVDVNRKGRQSGGPLLIEGILGKSRLTRRGRRTGPAGLTPGLIKDCALGGRGVLLLFPRHKWELPASYEGVGCPGPWGY
jgi:hypothetical protein